MQRKIPAPGGPMSTSLFSCLPWPSNEANREVCFSCSSATTLSSNLAMDWRSSDNSSWLLPLMMICQKREQRSGLIRQVLFAPLRRPTGVWNTQPSHFPEPAHFSSCILCEEANYQWQYLRIILPLRRWRTLLPWSCKANLMSVVTSLQGYTGC